ncbi:MAG: aspartate kinase [Lachnospirales bacterium]
MLVVQKFGGTSVADSERIFNVAKRVIETYKKGNKVVVVLSAQGDTTDTLLEKAGEITSSPSKRELDMLLATGEQQSVALMTMAIHKLGYPAISFNGFQFGMLTTSKHGNARIRRVTEIERIKDELEKNSIVVCAGFQGFNRHKDVTTLGRGGSDTTAVALSVALKADLCEIYTDVDGVYTADPRYVNGAIKLNEISYEEMLELASLGAKVLHYRCVELAKKNNVNLIVRSSMTNEEGTLIREVTKVEKMIVSGIAVDKNTARISVLDVPDQPGIAYLIFGRLSNSNITVDIILQSAGNGGNKKNVSFTVPEEDLEKAVEVLNDYKNEIGFREVTFDKNVAKLSVVGAGMIDAHGVATTMFECLYDEGVNIDLISTSEIKITVLVDQNVVNNAANALHAKFLDSNIKVGE